MSKIFKRRSMLFMAGIIPLVSVLVLSGQALSQSGERTVRLESSEVTIIRGGENGRDVVSIKTKNGSTILVAVNSDGSSTVTNESSSGDRTTTSTDGNGNQTTTPN